MVLSASLLGSCGHTASRIGIVRSSNTFTADRLLGKMKAALQPTSAGRMPVIICRHRAMLSCRSARRSHGAVCASACATIKSPASKRAMRTQAKQLVLDAPVLAEALVSGATGAEMIMWQVALDIVLPVCALLLLYKAIDAGATRARAALTIRVAGEGALGLELQRHSTLLGLVLCAVRGPATFMLPPLLVAYVLRTSLSIVDILNVKYKRELPALVESGVKAISSQLTTIDSHLSTVLGLSGIFFVTWFFIELKDIFIREVLLVRATRSGHPEMGRVLAPVSTVITWAVIAACAAYTCGLLGINLRPLLTVGGMGGLAAGLAAQQVLQNLVSGLNIFLSRPFVVGDQVVFSGGADVEGTVESVEVMRTLVKTADGSLVAVPNNVVAALVVSNRTRALVELPSAAAKAAAAPGTAAAPLRRLLCFKVQLPRDTEARVEEVRGAVKAYLQGPDAQLLASMDGGDGQGRPREVVLPTATFTGAALASDNGAAAAATAVLEAPPKAAAVAAEIVHDNATPAQLLRVSVELAALAADHLQLFVRTEVLYDPAHEVTSAEARSEAILLGVSRLVKERYGGLVLF